MEYLLEKHVGLIHACVRYLEIGGVPYMEAVEEGRIGLWRAILRYDPRRQVAFSTFAWRGIKGAFPFYYWTYCGIPLKPPLDSTNILVYN